ncbi:ATP-binding cassette domain-containing protein [Candidatus Poribacteria bacterium]|nr:molybdenum ABC transporter ATP-binding protein [Candidatus Poribacteria bacterium]MCH2574191.1 ATP-binding cassette domain-containing protein [Candidatus Poribacteria bacterium]|tara:strand:- start:137 stop:1018 length:882 start_codon:yes stop_codon:yes gene_type:complete
MIEFNLEKQLFSADGLMELQVDVQIEANSFVTIYGKSGAGKTSILRMLAGLMHPDTGYIWVNGNVWLDTKKNIDRPPQKRSIGFLFQDYALFPNMTVRQNLHFALTKGQAPQIIDDLIELVELGDLQHRKPNMLSGGQKQRVALARSLVQRPQILMLDEPLSALDVDMQYKLQQYILCLHYEYELTTILISHDLAEIIKMSDYVLAIEQGRITKRGQPAEIFTNQRAINGGCEFVGKIIDINQQGVMFVLTILIGTDSVQVIADKDEIHQFRPGDTVFVGLTSFNPVLRKIDL